jgi:hypothetical protein
LAYSEGSNPLIDKETWTIQGIEAALIFYDVMCQWSVHMMERVITSKHLRLPDKLKLKLVISLFHIHGDQDTCLPRYSPSFIEGGRQIDGETIKTLWAPKMRFPEAQEECQCHTAGRSSTTI